MGDSRLYMAMPVPILKPLVSLTLKALVNLVNLVNVLLVNIIMNKHYRKSK